MHEPVMDWLHLPSDVEAVSLWDSLHDAKLQSISSDLLACTITLEFDVYYLRGFHGFAEGIRFIWRFEEVASVRACSFAIWPGEAPDLQGKSVEEQNRLVTEYQSKWREQSLAWEQVENLLQESEEFFDTQSADLAESESNVALHLQGHLDDRWTELFIRAKSYAIALSDGRLLTLQEFLRLGAAYWDAFAARKGEKDN